MTELKTWNSRGNFTFSWCVYKQLSYVTVLQLKYVVILGFYAGTSIVARRGRPWKKRYNLVTLRASVECK